MIPKNIDRRHIFSAIADIERVGVPSARNSRVYYLEHSGKHYPPKYTISVANKYANGHELDSNDFIATEAVTHLTKLGFTIVRR